MSSIYNHLRQGRDKSISELKTFIRAEVELQERLETMRYRSPTWRLLRALQSLLSAVQLQGESAVTAQEACWVSWGEGKGESAAVGGAIPRVGA